MKSFIAQRRSVDNRASARSIEGMKKSALFVGIDGGGTGCRARLADAHGSILGEGRGGPASVRLGVDVAWQAVTEAVGAALRSAGVSEEQQAIYGCAALAGISRDGARDALEAKPHSFARLMFTSDSRAACLGAHAGADGGIVIAGTGSIAFALMADQDIRIGGYGIPVSDEGSGADCGIAAVRALLIALDGRCEPTAFTNAMAQKFIGGASAVVAWMDRASGTDYAAFAPLVFDYADQHDPVAKVIAVDAGHKISALVHALAKRGVPRIALLGGLSRRILLYLDEAARVRISPAKGDAMDGALLLARRLVPSADHSGGA